MKKVHALQKFMLVSITFVAINHEEMLKRDFASKNFFEVKAVAIRLPLPSPLQCLIICCRVYFLRLLSFTYESAETEENFREIHN